MNTYVLVLALTLVPVFSAYAASTPSRLLSSAALTQKQANDRCLDLDLSESKLDCTTCKVVGVQPLADVDGQKLSIARYEYFWAKGSGLNECGYGSVVMTEARSQLKPIWGGFGTAKSLKQPKVFKKDGASFVSIPVRDSGQFDPQNDGLISFKGGQWHEIDAATYKAELQKKFPANSWLQKDLYPNFDNMTVASEIWKKDDPRCCPTGGKFTAKLSIENDRVIATDVTFASEK